jgi:Na+(H+)/acetate symporter ActP
MTPEIILAAVAIIPVVLLMLLRINATLVFLSLCLGNVLVQFVSPDVHDFLTLFSSKSAHNVSATDQTIKIALLLLPVVLTAVFMIRTIRGNGKLFLNLLPAAGVGLLGALLIVPLLPGGISHNLMATTIWTETSKAQDLIVGASALICLFVLWLQRPKTGGEDKHHKH